MCSQHRHLLFNHRKKARQFWGEMVLQARQQLSESQVHSAIILYGNATEAAEILLFTDDERERAEIRYSRTAVEMAYALQLRNCKCDAKALLEWCSEQLDNVDLVQPKTTLIAPLIQAANSNRSLAKEWTKTRPLNRSQTIKRNVLSTTGALTLVH